jgi:putative ABC transport system permease protein
LGSVGMVFHAQLRHRWRSWLAITILISLVGGVVMAAVAAGQRTDSAIPRFVAAHGFDAEVYSSRPAPGIDRLPGVASATPVIGPDNGPPKCACTHPIGLSNFGVAALKTGGGAVFNLVSGRLPDPSNPHEVVASYTLQHDEGVQLGSIISVPFYSRSQAAAVNDATAAPPPPTGPTLALRVVGFEATEFDFPSGAAPDYLLWASPAFTREVLPRVGMSYLYFVRLRHGAADLPRFDAAASKRGPNSTFVQNVDAQVASVEASVHPQAIGWWLLAALAALVGLAVVGQALGRQSIAESEEYPTLVALGLERRQLAMLGNARSLAVGLAGAVGAVAIATLLSPIAPLGEARAAETSTGITFDALVLTLGALVTVAIVVALGIWPAVRASRTARTSNPIVDAKPSKLPGLLGSMGAPPSMEIGVRNALERRSGGANVPVGSALLGTVLAVVALCGTAVFGASLTHLTATPKLYGDPFQLNISNPNGGRPDPTVLRSLEHDRAVTGLTQGIALPAITIGKVVVGALAGTAVRGSLLMSTVDGRSPDAKGEVGLGGTTMHAVGARVGSVVDVTVSLPSGGKRTAPFRVVGQMSLPVIGNAVALGNGAVFTMAGYEDAACAPGPARTSCREEVAQSTNGGILASFVPGPRGQAAVNRYLDQYRSITTLALTPTSLINFGEAVNFPLIFGAMLALFGAATLLHLLVVSISRRRREVGLLKVVGFVNRQVASTVAWQATSLAVVGIVIGVPVGIVVGRAVWLTFANNLGAVPVSVVPVWFIGALIAAVLVGANLIALAPALVATRSKPRDLLRTV